MKEFVQSVCHSLREASIDSIIISKISHCMGREYFTLVWLRLSAFTLCMLYEILVDNILMIILFFFLFLFIYIFFRNQDLTLKLMQTHYENTPIQIQCILKI